MVKQKTLDKLIGTTSLNSDVEYVQGKDILYVQLYLSHDEDNSNKNSNIEKEIIINEIEAAIIVDLSDENEARTSSNAIIGHDNTMQTANEVTVISQTAAILSK
ncbi:unnamed protein product [Rotaria sp. Silwood1]|nr:unnamed protein product [Rotaria sp. Silwood1]CAF3901833.1 unnamed protein product [Rotaria sp. Silwood1]CAF3932057.1 unnamed protein product [Rotaria sp. Silwood1]CAF4035199.1 unnamed protein product [Rotaria sp. Silwood1]CAF4994485.1 unnamed protein product [Rotaria sp. Silwood1]